MTTDPGFAVGPFTTDWAGTADEEPAFDPVQVATGIMLSLLGWRWTWPARTVTEEYSVGSIPPAINLTGRPVSGVASVTSATGDPVPFKLVNGFKLMLGIQPVWNDISQLYLWEPCHCPSGPYTVVYTYGAMPPMAVRRAITVLADEIRKASCGDSDCRLPERVTSVSRQGLSWTLIDPQDFLDKGKTGIIEVDLVLVAYNSGKAQRRSRVWSPEFAPPQRIDQAPSGP